MNQGSKDTTTLTSRSHNDDAKMCSFENVYSQSKVWRTPKLSITK